MVFHRDHLQYSRLACPLDPGERRLLVFRARRKHIGCFGYDGLRRQQAAAEPRGGLRVKPIRAVDERDNRAGINERASHRKRPAPACVPRRV